MPVDSDAELIAKVLKGDLASFEPLVAKYQPRVFATARRYAFLHGIEVAALISVEDVSESDLPLIARAFDSMRLSFGVRQRRQAVFHPR